MDDGFVDAYSKRTGKKVRVPGHFIGHPVLGKGFNKTPRQKAADSQAEDSATTTKAPASGDKKE
jgi:hypothetical protein